VSIVRLSGVVLSKIHPAISKNEFKYNNPSMLQSLLENSNIFGGNRDFGTARKK
jgi:hypothetical protein